MKGWGWLLSGALVVPAVAQAVSITQAPQVFVGRRQVTVAWKTDVSGTTELAWGASSAPNFASYAHQSVAVGGALVGTKHSHTLRRLPEGTYFFRVRSTDGAAPVESVEATFTVPRSELFPWSNVAFNGPVEAVAYANDTWYFGGIFTDVGPIAGGAIATGLQTG